MNDDKMSIPYIAFEGELARAERHIKRLWIVNIILIIALILFIDGLTYEHLAEMYELSVSHIKNIVYKNEYTIYDNL